MALLTKSGYLKGRQCPKYLWTFFHEPRKIPGPGTVDRYRLDQGTLVGNLAKTLFPHGKNISTVNNTENAAETEKLLLERVPIFEAGFLIEKLFSRVDILVPAEKNEWDILEVKSSTGVKEVHIHDLAFQKYNLEKCGLTIRNCVLVHINNQYVKQGDFDPAGFFTFNDRTLAVNKIFEDTGKRIEEMLTLADQKISPDVPIGRHCNNPYECPLKVECWDFLPEYHVFQLYRGGRKIDELQEKDIYALRDIPGDFKLSNKKQEIQKECAITGKPHVNHGKIQTFLNTLVYPLYYLDFETFGPPIPIYEGTKPFQKIPFQFSLHVVEENGDTRHHSFLAEGKGDPRPAFLDALKDVLGEKGSVVVYNRQFEKSVLTELAEVYPGFKPWTERMIARFIDLLIPFRGFDYYNPVQQGSASIKKVLPALTGKGYEDMDIDNGENASLAFAHITFGDVPEEEIKKIREDLETYCALDTEGMVRIVDALRRLT